MVREMAHEKREGTVRARCKISDALLYKNQDKCTVSPINQTKYNNFRQKNQQHSQKNAYW